MNAQVQTNIHRIFIGLFVCAMATACSRIPRDQAAFQRAEQLNTASGYQQFLQYYPNSPLAPEARKRAAQLQEQHWMSQFKEIENATKASVVERFMKYHPQPELVLMAKLRIAQIDYSEIETQSPFRATRPGNGSYREFVNYYAFSDYIPVPGDASMRERYYKTLHPLLLQAMRQVRSFDMWARYLATYPDSPYFQQAAGDVEKLIEENLDKWDGYEMLMNYLSLYDNTLKRPCANRNALIRQAQDKLAAMAERENTLAHYERYLQTFADSPHVKRITLLRDHIRFGEARERKDRAMMERLIAQYKDHPDPLAKTDVAEATAFLERIDFDAAVSANTPKAFRDFMSQYKGRDFAGLIPEADARLKRIHNQMLLSAKSAGTSAKFRQFLEVFPDTPSKDDVLKLLEEAEFKEAIAGSDTAAIQAVMARYPSSPFRERALNRIDDIEYKAVETRALEEPSTAPLKEYLERRPQGRHAVEAEDLIKRLNQHHAQYETELQRARESGNIARFNKFIVESQGNHYTARRGQQDLELLRRETTAKQLAADLASTATQAARAVFPAAPARAVTDSAQAIVYVESNTGTSTGFFFAREGLILTNARMLANAVASQVKVRIANRARPARVVAIAAAPADLAVLRVEGTYDPIAMGNPTLLAAGERLVCLATQGTKVETLEGTFHSAKKSGDVEWLLIQSSKINPNLGGVVVNQSGRAVGLVVRSDVVDAAVKESGEDFVYAISMRSAFPLMEKAILGK
ncbi:MAG: trypsin-like peptidase domain-containing protein [Candidatus Sumerlaeia bacterium]|nr:trypsin-like peptidase domain-containing protein [Candidatus Sumerlaeia bacterium]